MSPKKRYGPQWRTGHGPSSWPAFLMLVVTVALPTASVLWFMAAAVKSERLAGRQRLSEVYAAQLEGIRSDLDVLLRDRLGTLPDGTDGARGFAEIVTSGLADSAIFFGGEPHPEHPYPSSRTDADTRIPAEDVSALEEAQALEYRHADPRAAAEAFGAIAARVASDDLAARALQARARSLSKAGEREAALDVLLDDLAAPRFEHARDEQGREIALNALLFAVELAGELDSPRASAAAETLATRLATYVEPAMPSTQRRFLMREVQRLAPQSARFPTLAAEELAARYLDSKPSWDRQGGLRASGLAGVWQLDDASGRARLFFTEAGLARLFASVIEGQRLPAHARIELVRPWTEFSRASALAYVDAGELLPYWGLAVRVDDPGLSDSAAEERIGSYLAIGIAVAALVLLIGAFAARSLGRQVRHTRLKNDLLATVSHELKTPLSSMRLLVDTLLASDRLDEKQAREYLALIAGENGRLSRLIDNFLTFSRLERNRQKFAREELDPADLVSAAEKAAGERFREPSCRLDVEAEPGLPRVDGDRDALVGVLLNLLDNAHKYSGDEKHIVLRARKDGGSVCFEVQDNGIGLTQAEARRVFDPFYQADQRLSRKGGGCGLGLSIVRSIVRAHAGVVGVESEKGRGSTFSVRLPAAVTPAKLSRAAL